MTDLLAVTPLLVAGLAFAELQLRRWERVREADATRASYAAERVTVDPQLVKDLHVLVGQLRSRVETLESFTTFARRAS